MSIMRPSSPEQGLKRSGTGDRKSLKINKMIAFPDVVVERQ